MVTKITIPYDPMWRPLDWAIKYCPSYITNDVEILDTQQCVSTDKFNINYYFNNTQDSILFALRWK